MWRRIQGYRLFKNQFFLLSQPSLCQQHPRRRYDSFRWNKAQDFSSKNEPGRQSLFRLQEIKYDHRLLFIHPWHLQQCQSDYLYHWNLSISFMYLFIFQETSTAKILLYHLAYRCHLLYCLGMSIRVSKKSLAWFVDLQNAGYLILLLLDAYDFDYLL